MLGTSAQGLTMTIPPALTMLPETGRVTVTVPWLLLVVLVLVPPACTICAPAKLAAGMVIIPVKKLEIMGFLRSKNPKAENHEKVQIENRIYLVAGRYHRHWRADRQWSVHQPSVPPADPAHWSADPEGRQGMESPGSVILLTTGPSTEENTAPGSVLPWWPPVAAGWWSAEADLADPGAAESDHPEAGSDLAAPAGSTHGNTIFSQPLSNAWCDPTHISWQVIIPFRGRNLQRLLYFSYKSKLKVIIYGFTFTTLNMMPNLHLNWNSKQSYFLWLDVFMN